jgi:hypothetical protein
VRRLATAYDPRVTFAPPTLIALGTYWTAHGGVNLGIVGDASHVSGGVSYHLGRDDLRADAYSRQTARDRAGLSNAASAIDLGKLGGSYGNLRTFSKWLVSRARANALGTADMREIIYSPDGITVLRWDRERGFASAPRSGEASDSHRFHTHISWYRDAEFRDHRVAFGPYEGFEMNVIYVQTGGPGRFDIAAGTTARGFRNDGDKWVVAKTLTPQTQTGARYKAAFATPADFSPRSLLLVEDGYFAGLYVPTSDTINEKPDVAVVPVTLAPGLYEVAPNG